MARQKGQRYQRPLIAEFTYAESKCFWHGRTEALVASRPDVGRLVPLGSANGPASSPLSNQLRASVPAFRIPSDPPFAPMRTFSAPSAGFSKTQLGWAFPTRPVDWLRGLRGHFPLSTPHSLQSC